MIIDSSVLIAILDQEDDAFLFAKAIEENTVRLISVVNYVETSFVIERRHKENGRTELDYLMARAEIEIVPASKTQAEIARMASRLYGRGFHKAGLNSGDCFAYALSRETGLPLLYKGRDFAQTDVLSVL